MHRIDRACNVTSPLLSIDDMRRHRMVVGCDVSTGVPNGQPGKWHARARTHRRLMTPC